MWLFGALEYAEQIIALMESGIILCNARKTGFLFAQGIIARKLDMNRLRLDLGYGIILGLEFMVGADIFKSMMRPTFYDLGLVSLQVS